MKIRKWCSTTLGLKPGVLLFVAIASGTALATATVAQQEREAAPRDSADREQAQQRDGSADRADPREADRREERGGALGVMVAPRGAAEDEKGIAIERVAPGSPADQAGLRAGDKILFVDGEKVASHEELIGLLRTKEAGSEVNIRVLRDDQQMDVKATLAPFERVYERSRRAGFRGDEDAPGAEKNAWLGVHLDDSAEAEGAKVVAVYPSGPAARAGLRDGDVIVRAGDQEIGSAEELAEFVEKSEPDSEIEFSVLRGENERKLPVRLGSRMVFAELQGRTFADGEKQDQEARRFNREDMLDNLPEHALLVEQNRQLCIQNERLERLLLHVLQDVEALREEVAAIREGGAGPAGAVREQPEDTATEDDRTESEAPGRAVE